MSQAVASSSAAHRGARAASVARAVHLTLGVLVALLAGCAVPGDAQRGDASPTAGPTPAAVPATDGAGPATGPALPPAAILASAPGGPVAGTLGSWTFENSGSDSPWLPAAQLGEIQVGAGARLTVRLAGGEPIGAWSAQVAAADDARAEHPSAAGGREAADPPLDEVALEIAEPGRWVLAVRLELADGRGDATWYWLVSVS